MENSRIASSESMCISIVFNRNMLAVAINYPLGPQ